MLPWIPLYPQWSSPDLSYPKQGTSGSTDVYYDFDMTGEFVSLKDYILPPLFPPEILMEETKIPLPKSKPKAKAKSKHKAKTTGLSPPPWFKSKKTGKLYKKYVK